MSRHPYPLPGPASRSRFALAPRRLHAHRTRATEPWSPEFAAEGPEGPEGEGELIQQYDVRLVKTRKRRVPRRFIGGSEDLAYIARVWLGDLPHEEIVVLGLSSRNEVIGVIKVSQGGIGGAAVLPADILRPLVVMGARAFVIAHNHPSGDSNPSQDDLRMTRTLKERAGCAGIELLDHVIVGGRGGGWTSMRDLGVMP